MKGTGTSTTPNPHPMIPVPEAIRIVFRETARLIDYRHSPFTVSDPYDPNDRERLLHQTLAQDVLMAPPGYPPYRASIMDGYAIDTTSYDIENPNSKQQPRRYRVVDRIYAGDDASATDATRQSSVPEQHRDNALTSLPTAYYVTTGAVIPEGCDCVVPIEDVTVAVVGGSGNGSGDGGDDIVIELSDTAAIAPNKWIRAVGCDLPAYSVVLPVGHVLDPIALGLIRQSACPLVSVLPKITVGVLSTGNELVSDNQQRDWIASASSSSKSCKIPDVNRPILISLLQSWNNCRVVDLGQVRDDDDGEIFLVLQEAISEKKCQIIVTTGGISMGETDRLEYVITELLQAQVHFGRLHMKPGKPTTFATLAPHDAGGGVAIFCLPGNPVSATVCAHLLVRVCLELWFQAPLIPPQLQQQVHQQQSSSGIGSPEDLLLLLQQLVDRLPVLHPEVSVVLQNDVVLDVERPEYHRVRLEYCRANENNNDNDSNTNTNNSSTAAAEFYWAAHSTGIQQSSRLASMLQATAVVPLPQASPEQPKALKGQVYTALLLTNDNPLLFPRRRVGDSQHLSSFLASSSTMSKSKAAATLTAATTTTTTTHKSPKSDRTFAVDIMLITANASANTAQQKELLSQQVQASLSGSRSGAVTIASCRTYEYSNSSALPSSERILRLWEEVCRGCDDNNGCVDIQILVCRRNVSIPSQWELATFLRTSGCLTKLADAVALQARKGAASAAGTAALFEVVVGFLDADVADASNNNRGGNETSSSRSSTTRRTRLVMLLPLEGLTKALENVRGLVKHALEIARG